MYIEDYIPDLTVDELEFATILLQNTPTLTIKELVAEILKGRHNEHTTEALDKSNPSS